jgi:transposase
MSTVKLRQDQWRKMLKFLREHPRVHVGKASKCKRFIEAVMWMDRSGAQWRLLPASYGHWNSVYKRFDRWSEHGIWEAMFERFSNHPDMESVMIDSSVIRAHASAAGAPHEKGGKIAKPSVTVAADSAASFT